MIRIPFERDRLSHGHLVHPLELAHLVHYSDSRKLIERDQSNALEACSTELRKMAPLVAELVGNTQPGHPLQHLVPNITAMLTRLREEVDSRIVATNQAFASTPTPFTPYDACGRMRGLHDCYPAPLLRQYVYPHSRSAPPTVDRKRVPQPWFHVSTRNFRSPRQALLPWLRLWALIASGGHLRPCYHGAILNKKCTSGELDTFIAEAKFFTPMFMFLFLFVFAWC